VFAGLAFANRLPPNVVPVLCASRGVSIPKKDGGWRPLGVGNAVRRAIGSLKLALIGNQRLEECAGPMQFAAGCRSGTTLAGLAMKWHLDEVSASNSSPMCHF